MWLFYLILKGIMTFYSQRVSAFFELEYKLEQKRNGIGNGKSHIEFKRDEPCASAQIKSQIKSKTVMSWNSRRKKKTFFVPFILSEGNCFKICVLSQCIGY